MLRNDTGTVKTARLRRSGIPTLYRGTQFRSRLEAAWGAFFDELRWPWQYEPTDLDGYIPDFDLLFAKRPLLLEIKPTEESFDLAKSKLECSGWEGEAAILTSAETSAIGIMFDGDIWAPAVLAFCLACQRATIIQECGDWSCRNCNASSRELKWSFDPAPHWATAKNIVQWMPRA